MKYEGTEIIQKYIMSGDTSFAFKLNFFCTDFVLNHLLCQLTVLPVDIFTAEFCASRSKL